MKQFMRLPGVFCVALLLSACSGEVPVVSAPPPSDAGATEQQAQMQPQEAQPVTSGDPTVSDIICPKIELRSGTETLRSFELGSPGAEADLKWQANITNIARECSILGVEVGIKAALSGRVILGPKGKPGTFTVPVRLAVVRNGKEPLWSRVANVEATVPAGEASGLFTLVIEDILFPREANDNLSTVQVYVGFDPAVPQDKPKKVRGKR